MRLPSTCYRGALLRDRCRRYRRCSQDRVLKGPTAAPSRSLPHNAATVSMNLGKKARMYPLYVSRRPVNLDYGSRSDYFCIGFRCCRDCFAGCSVRVETSTAQRSIRGFRRRNDDALELLDVLLEEDKEKRLCDLDRWEEFHQARHQFDLAWGQVRLVAPANIAEHARKVGFALLEFDRNARLLPVAKAKSLRQDNPFLSWDHAESFVTVARRDLKVEPWIMAVRRRH